MRHLLLSLALLPLAACSGSHLSASVTEHPTPTGGVEVDACLVLIQDRAPALLSAEGGEAAVVARKKK